MRLLDTLGALAIPGSLPSGIVLFVDRFSGNDSLAARGRMVPAFQTLGAAKNAAQSGDTIIVFPATYTEWDLAKNGVNWHFLIGAKVDPGGSATTSLFASTSGVYSVTGYGDFTISGSSKFVLSGTFSNVTFKCLKMTANSGAGCIDVPASSGILSVECDIAQSTTGVCVGIVSGTNNVAIQDIRVHTRTLCNLTKFLSARAIPS